MKLLREKINTYAQIYLEEKIKIWEDVLKLTHNKDSRIDILGLIELYKSELVEINKLKKL